MTEEKKSKRWKSNGNLHPRQKEIIDREMAKDMPQPDFGEVLEDLRAVGGQPDTEGEARVDGWLARAEMSRQAENARKRNRYK